MNKKKIINDAVYGLITIPSEIIFDLIEHPYFQRLRRIQQLGLSNMVYPGANHTRFHHTLGAMHLMRQALEVLKSKGVAITDEETEAVTIAILMHDIGHGPYSHTLERTIVQQVSHEELSLLFMERLNREFKGKLTLAIKIFKDEYKKKFLHQLVSGQLDMDRLDYLTRDSFFTGVEEGVVGYDRIIKILAVHKGQLMVEAKGIYSMEKFIISRRLMYWQVYLHKTVLTAEQTLVRILQRAKELTKQGENLFASPNSVIAGSAKRPRVGHAGSPTEDPAGTSEKLFASPALKFFLENNFTRKDFHQRPELLNQFAQLDDMDIFGAVKVWQQSKDKVLSFLSRSLVNRELFHIEIQNEKFSKQKVDSIKRKIKAKLKLTDKELQYYYYLDSTSNSAYNMKSDRINLLFKDGTVKDIAAASDQLNISVLSEPVTKYYLCYPKEI